MVRAIWNGAVIAESDETVVIEGNHYFPAASVDATLLRPSSTTTVCPWKGRASYHSLVVNGKENKDAAWFYPQTTSAAAAIEGRVAFWHGVKIEDDGGPEQRRSFFDRFRRQDTAEPVVAHAHAHAGPPPVLDLGADDFFESLEGHATIVDLWAPWCGPCKTMHPIFEHLAHHYAGEHLQFAKVNVDESPGIASGLRVMSIPTLILFDQHGNEVDRIVGLADERTLLRLVDRAAKFTEAGSA